MCRVLERVRVHSAVPDYSYYADETVTCSTDAGVSWIMLLQRDPRGIPFSGRINKIGVMYKLLGGDDIRQGTSATEAVYICREKHRNGFALEFGQSTVESRRHPDCLPDEALCLIPASIPELRILGTLCFVELPPLVAAHKRRRTICRVTAILALEAAAALLLGPDRIWPRDMTREIVLWAWPRLLWRQI